LRRELGLADGVEVASDPHRPAASSGAFMTKLHSQGIPLAALAIAAGAQPAHASGFRVEHQNARAMGAAYAGAHAINADAGMMIFNPAALAGLERPQVSASVVALFGPAEFSNASGALFGVFPVAGAAEGDGVLSTNIVPAAAIAAPVSDRLTLGLSASTPFGLKSEYPGNAIARYYAQRTSLLTIALTPSAAYEVTDRLSIGAGLRLQYARFDAFAVVDAGGAAFASAIPGFLPGSSDLFAEFGAEDFEIGFIVGAQLQATDRLRLGVSYASKMTHDLEGAATFDRAGSPAAAVLNAGAGVFSDTDFMTALSLPSVIAASVVFDATERVRILGSLERTAWSTFKELSISFENPLQPDELFDSQWSDSYSAAIGVEYAPTARTTWRAGFAYDDSPVNEALASPQIPDTDRRWLTVGASFAPGPAWTLDLAAGLNVAPKTRTIARDGSAAGDLLRGALSMDINVDTYVASARIRRSF